MHLPTEKEAKEAAATQLLQAIHRYAAAHRIDSISGQIDSVSVAKAYRYTDVIITFRNNLENRHAHDPESPIRRRWRHQ